LDETGFTDTESFSRSEAYSDDSSIARFPSFTFNSTALSTLASLQPSESRPRRASKKVSLLVAVIEVEGPESIRIKKGVDAGKVVSLLKLIIADDDSSVAKVVAWRDVADNWGGNTEEIAVKKGDIVLLESEPSRSSLPRLYRSVL
jgi:hypothetical protein